MLMTSFRKLFLIEYFIFLLTFFCFNSLASVKNTHHDFSGAGWSNGEICIACHTPHNANVSVANSPLWNHNVTNNTYTLYSSSTFDATATQPNSTTKLCLSCHDGTIALDAIAGNSGSSYIRVQTSRGVPIRINSDLFKHHPVSIRYDSALASVDAGLYDPSVTASGLGSTIANDMLNNGILECSSCHDVHVKRGTGSCTDCHNFSYPSYYLETLSLVKSNDKSALCFTCHNK